MEILLTDININMNTKNDKFNTICESFNPEDEFDATQYANQINEAYGDPAEFSRSFKEVMDHIKDVNPAAFDKIGKVLWTTTELKHLGHKLLMPDTGKNVAETQYASHIPNKVDPTVNSQEEFF